MLEARHIERLFIRWASAGLQPTAAIQKQLNRDTDAVVDVWLDIMAAERVTVEEFALALRAFEATGPKFWASAIELRAHVPRLAVNTLDRSEEAWGLFHRMVTGSPGSRALAQMAARGMPWVRDPDMDRRMKHASTALGGPRKAGQMSDRDLVANRASFRLAYRAVADEEDTTRKAKPLPVGVAHNVVMFPVPREEA